MADTSAFQPQGDAYLVDDSAAVQVIGGKTSVCYRIRNTGASAAWVGYAAAKADGTTPSVNTTAPIVGTPQAGIVGLLASAAEIFRFPPGAWFKASTGATFEIEAGTGS